MKKCKECIFNSDCNFIVKYTDERKVCCSCDKFQSYEEKVNCNTIAKGEPLTANEEQSLENIAHELGFEKIPEDEFWR